MNCGDGLTHGTSILHTGGESDADWVLRSPKHISEHTKSILAEENPYQHYREQSMKMLQALWNAHLEQKRKTVAAPDAESFVLKNRGAACRKLWPLSSLSGKSAREAV